MFVLDIYSSTNNLITGKDLEKELDLINITLNKNQIPNDTLSPMVSSGVRIGTPAMTTKGFKEDDFESLAALIHVFIQQLIEKKNNEKHRINYDYFKAEVKALINKKGV